MKIIRNLELAVGGLLALGLAGCSDDGTSEPGVTAATYLVDTTLFGADGNATTYIAPLDSLGADVEVDTRAALESPGMAKLYARPGLGYFALGSGEEPTITRYALTDDGKFEAGDSITFQPRGVAWLGDTVVFVSDDKAYYFDAPNDQLIVWNPKDMEVTGAIDLSVAAREGLPTIYDLKPLLRPDGTLLFPVAWANNETGVTYPGTGLMVIDTAKDELSDYTVSEQCQGITWSALTDDGAIYAGTAPFYAVRQRVNGEGPAACVLRVQPGETTFDADYHVDLADLVDGRVAGGLAKGPGDVLFFRAVEPEVEIGAETDPSEVWSGANWRWQRWDLKNDQVTAVESLPPSAAGGLTYDVDGKVFATDSAADWSSTTLIDLTAPGGPEAALTAPGYIYGLARLR